MSAESLLEPLKNSSEGMYSKFEDLIHAIIVPVCCSKDPLKGEEAQRLRTFCTSNSVIPARDLDQYGLALMIGDLMSVKSDFSGRVARLASATRSVEEARAAAAKELFALKWGPTRTPIYDLLIVGTVLVPSKRENQLKVAHWLVHDAKVPVNGRDLSGSTAMNHAISTKPVFDPDFAEILYEGGGDVNDRNRYGCTPAHEIIMIMDARNSQAVRAPVGAMRWFLSHGGNLDIKDNEGVTARGTFTKTCAMLEAFPSTRFPRLSNRTMGGGSNWATDAAHFVGENPTESSSYWLVQDARARSTVVCQGTVRRVTGLCTK